MSILLSAMLLCGLNVDTAIVDAAIWKENGDHIFVIGNHEYNVGGECYDMTNDGGGIHKYTWINREGIYEINYVRSVFFELNGNLIGVEE